MWEERERWRQRLRGVVLVVGLSILVAAGWQVYRDPRSMPTILSGDGIFGDSRVDPRAAPASAAPDGSRVRSGAPPERSPGSGSTGGGAGSGSRNYRVAPSGGREMAAGVADEDEEQSPGGARRGLPGSDCVADPDTSPTSARGRQTPPGEQPCEPATDRSAKPSSPPTQP